MDRATVLAPHDAGSASQCSKVPVPADKVRAEPSTAHFTTGFGALRRALIAPRCACVRPDRATLSLGKLSPCHTMRGCSLDPRAEPISRHHDRSVALRTPRTGVPCVCRVMGAISVSRIERHFWAPQSLVFGMIYDIDMNSTQGRATTHMCATTECIQSASRGRRTTPTRATHRSHISFIYIYHISNHG